MPLTFSVMDTANMDGYVGGNGDSACKAVDDAMANDQMCSEEGNIASCNQSPSKDAEHAEEEKFTFDPPLYMQRYTEVRNILDEEKVVTVADMGTSEGKIIPYLKRIASIQELNAVDLDEDPISGARSLCSPLISDYVIPSSTPLTVRLWQGDVTKFDSRFQNLDAITMVEVIEHLNPDVLEALPNNLFGRLHPRLVILTTPNSEFNVLFPNFSGFRHWDHKFEWTRAEFESWCTEQARTYDYDVSFSGVGAPPPDRTDVGPCSQTALFRRKYDSAEMTNGPTACEEPYKLLHEVVHPYQPARTLDEDILYEAGYYIRQRATEIVREYEEWRFDAEQVMENGEIYVMEEDVVHVSIEDLMLIKKVSKLCDLEKLKSVLMACDEFELSDDQRFVIHPMNSPEFLAMENDDYDEITSNDDRDTEYDAANTDDVLEDWGDDTDSDPTNKPWNDPANWDLPLEVANPEMVEKLRKTGGHYMQGFHGNPNSKNTRVSEKYQYCYYDIEPGQFDDEDIDCFGGLESKDITQKLSEISIGDSEDRAESCNMDCSDNGKMAEDSKVECNSTSSDKTSQDFRLVPLELLGHRIYTTSWHLHKPTYDTEENQFDSE